MHVDGRLTREYEGTGLGLALVHKLTDMQGGSVTVESELGKGSRFTINLPLPKELVNPPLDIDPENIPATDPRSTPHLPATHSTKKATVQLADDNMTKIMPDGDYLERHG